MKDLSTIMQWHCSTAEFWSTNVDKYVVRWSNWDHQNQDVQYDYSCTCFGYKFKKHCKHIKNAKEQHCNWMQFSTGEKVLNTLSGKYQCPNCKKEAKCMTWGV